MSLKIYIGPMFSSKTSCLIQEIKRFHYIFNKDEILVLTSKLDTQRNCYDEIKTHSLEFMKAVMIEKLNEIYILPEFKKAKVIFIDESHFFKGLYSFLFNELKSNNKIYVIAGLSSDYNLKPIGEILECICLANEIIKCKAICIDCRKDADFTKLIKNNLNQKQILVGNKNIYKAVCRECYFRVSI